MNSTYNKAILQSEGSQEYRGCKIIYFTYTMGMPEAVDKQHPSSYKINVDIHLQIHMNDCIKTMALDDSFADENAAIEYGIHEGKKFIDYLYAIDKISEVKSIPSSRMNINYGSSASLAKPKKKSQSQK